MGDAYPLTTATLEGMTSAATGDAAADGTGGQMSGEVAGASEPLMAASTPYITEIRVSSQSDDAEERPSGWVGLYSHDLDMFEEGSSGDTAVGISFRDLDIPRGAIITSAWLQFSADEEGFGDAEFLIRGQDADDAAAFARIYDDVSSRDLTSAAAQWAPGDWTTVGAAGAAERSSDLAAVVQEIVDRDGWTRESAMAFVITGSGDRTAISYEGDAEAAPLLHVEWQLPDGTDGPDTTPPEVALDPALDGETVSGIVSLTAIASDDTGVRDVRFRIDSEALGTDASAPYTFELDTTQFSDGTVAITAVATDLAGNRTVSQPLALTIDNGSGEPPPPPPPPSGTIRVPQDFATIQDAVDAAGDGDTIIVGPGTYDGGIVVAGKSVTIASTYALTGDAAAVDDTIIHGGAPAIYVADSAPGTVVQGFHFTGGTKSVQFFGEGGQALDNFFDDTGSDAISFEDVGGVARGNRIIGAGDDGIDVDYPAGDVVIENNVIQRAGDDGIEIRNGNYSGSPVTLTIRGNVIEGSDEDGIQIIDYSGEANREFRIERNLIRTSGDVGLGLMDGGETQEDYRAASMPERIYVINNTFDGNRYGVTGGDNLIALNNIVTNSSVLGLKNVDGDSIVADTLFFRNATDQSGSNVDEATVIEADPLFTDGFGLAPGSPAIDAGVVHYILDGETVLDMAASDYAGASADLGWLEA